MLYYNADGDWPEDASDENGDYECECCTCGRKFIGHKRRVTCRSCWEKHTREQRSRSSEESASRPDSASSPCTGVGGEEVGGSKPPGCSIQEDPKSYFEIERMRKRTDATPAPESQGEA